MGDQNKVWWPFRPLEMDWYTLAVYRSATLPEKGWAVNKT